MTHRQVLLLSICALSVTGCQSQLRRIFYQPALSHGSVAVDGDVILAAALGPDAASPTATRPTAAPATQPAPRGYTAPGGMTRQMSFLAVLATSTVMAGTGETEGQEAAQSSVGRPGLAASVQAGGPGLSVGVQSVGRRGLQQGAPLSGGLNTNIFAPRANPLTTRCQELVNAGFFGDVATCRARFSR